MKILKITATSLLIIAAAILVWAVWSYLSADNYLHKAKYLIVSKKIEFTAGKKYTGVFQVDENTKYYSSILFYRKIPDTVIDTLVGDDNPVSEKSNKGVLDLSFTLLENNTPIVKLDSLTERGFFYSENFIGRNAASFECEKNNNYRFTLEIKKTIPELNKTFPDFIITINPGYFKQQVVSAEISKIFIIPAIILFLVSLSSYIAVILFYKYKMRKLSNNNL